MKTPSKYIASAAAICVLLLFPLPAILLAKTDDEALLEAKKKELFAKAARELSGELPDGRLKSVLGDVVDNIDDWSKYAGEISAGQYDNALGGLAKYSAGKLSAHIKDKLPDGKAKQVYEFLEGQAGNVKEVAQAMIDPKKSWSDVFDLAWQKGSEEFKKNMQSRAEDVVKKTINYALGERSVLGYTPGDLYLMVAKTEVQVIKAWDKGQDIRIRNGLFDKYRKLREEGLSHDAAAQAAIDEGWFIGGKAFKGFRGFSEEQILKLFGEAYDDNAGHFAWWLEEKLSKAMQAEKSEVDKALQKAGEEVKGELQDMMKRLQAKYNKLLEKNMSEEEKKKRDKAVAEAKAILEKAKRARDGALAACKEFDAAKGKTKKAFDELTKLRGEIAGLRYEIDIAKQASGFAGEAKKLSDYLNAVNQLRREYDDFYNKAKEATDKSCKHFEEVKKAATKKDSKAALDKSIEEARKAGKLVQEGIKKGAEVKRKKKEFDSAYAEFTKKYGKRRVDAIQESVKKIAGMLERAKKASELAKTFEGAKAQMGEAVLKSGNFVQFIKDQNKTIVAKLKPFPQTGDVTSIQKDAEKAYEDAHTCWSTREFDWSGGSERWAKRQTPEVKIDEKALQEARAALKAAGALKDMPSLEQTKAKVAELASGVDAKVGDLTFLKTEYSLCVADAIVAYNDRWLKGDEEYRRAKEELDKAKEAAKLAHAAMSATQQAAQAASSAANQASSAEGAVAAAEAAAASASQKCADARNALSQVSSAVQAAANAKSQIDGCYNTSNSKFRESCQAAAGLQNVSKMSLGQIQSLESKSKAAAGACRAAASACDGNAKTAASQVAAAESVNKRLKGLLAEIAQLKAKISAAPGKIAAVEGVVSAAVTKAGEMQGKTAEAKGHASAAESARDNVVSILDPLKEEQKARDMIQQANTEAANARMWAGQAEKAAALAKAEASKAEAKLSSLKSRSDQASNAFSGCSANSGDGLVAQAKEHQLYAVAHARGAKDNAQAAEKCAQFVSLVASQKQNEPGDKGGKGGGQQSQTAAGGQSGEGEGEDGGYTMGGDTPTTGGKPPAGATTEAGTVATTPEGQQPPDGQGGDLSGGAYPQPGQETTETSTSGGGPDDTTGQQPHDPNEPTYVQPQGSGGPDDTRAPWETLVPPDGGDDEPGEKGGGGKGGKGGGGDGCPPGCHKRPDGKGCHCPSKGEGKGGGGGGGKKPSGG